MKEETIIILISFLILVTIIGFIILTINIVMFNTQISVYESICQSSGGSLRTYALDCKCCGEECDCCSCSVDISDKINSMKTFK